MIPENRHLSDALSLYKSYLDDEKQVPEEVLMSVIGELKVSRLLAPIENDGEKFIIDQVEIDDLKYLPLYTNTDEYEKHSDETLLLTFSFDDYRDIVLEDGLEGIVVNYENECIIFDCDFLKTIPDDAPLNIEQKGEAYSAEELKEIFVSATNEELLRFLDEDYNPEDLFVKLSGSSLLNIVCSAQKPDDSKDILNASDMKDFDLYTISDADICLAPVFSDKDRIREFVKDEELVCYGQIARLSAVIDYVLENDLDGIIINPGSDEKYIHRDDLISQARGIELIVEDSRFNNVSSYAFKI